ncbi:MAG: Uma2 family endonuclease [Myxococcales bacterium]|nr:Uma2 family endonuclease [Myxococcales bacterium]
MMSLPAAMVASTHDDTPKGDSIVLLRAEWSDWLRLQETRGDCSAPRFSFLDGQLQIISPSRHHERIKGYIGRLVETWALEAGIRLVPLGSWTLEDEQEHAGAEPDECYQIGPDEKERPDLAIEVVWTSGGLSKLEIYRRLGVPEVWTWRRGALHVHVLRDGAFVEVERSVLFPTLDLQLVLSLLGEPTLYDAQRALLRALRGTEG